MLETCARGPKPLGKKRCVPSEDGEGRECLRNVMGGGSEDACQVLEWGGLRQQPGANSSIILTC